MNVGKEQGKEGSCQNANVERSSVSGRAHSVC